MILRQIVRQKLREIAVLKRTRPLASLKKVCAMLPAKKRVFEASLKKARGIAVIAEIKRRSPSKGLLRRDFSPAAIAKAYRRGGAAALSVLTDQKFFGGSADALKAVKRSVRLPVLRKDFILDEHQVYESRLMGADAVLLIASLLSRAKMRRLSELARRLGLDVLFEVHTAGEMRNVRSLKPGLIGINNRDLGTFRTDIRRTARLIKSAPKGPLIVSESGIQTHEDLLYLRGLGARAVLVGESLMREKNIERALKRLRGVK